MREPLKSFANRLLENREVPEFIKGLLDMAKERGINLVPTIESTIANSPHGLDR